MPVEVRKPNATFFITVVKDEFGSR